VSLRPSLCSSSSLSINTSDGHGHGLTCYYTSLRESPDAYTPSHRITINATYFYSWEGPVRLLHSMDVNLEDGSQTPYKGMLAFPKGQKALKISTTGSQEFPCTFGAEVPSFDRTKQLMAFQNDVWDSNPKHTMQGNVNEGGLGAVKAFPISDNIESVQIMWWSKDTGKRSCKSKIEVLQGPNSIRQVFDLHCEGSTQPYHAIIETPGTGWTIRMWSKNPMEYPHEIVVEPHTVSDNGALSGGDSLWWE